jgi:hypothetical protein
VHPSICPFVHLSVHLIFHPIHPSVYPSPHPSVDPSLCPSVHSSPDLSVNPSLHPSVHPSPHSSVSLSIRPSVHPPLYLSNSRYVHPPIRILEYLILLVQKIQSICFINIKKYLCLSVCLYECLSFVASNLRIITFIILNPNSHLFPKLRAITLLKLKSNFGCLSVRMRFFSRLSLKEHNILETLTPLAQQGLCFIKIDKYLCLSVRTLCPRLSSKEPNILEYSILLVQ